jgi:hypothetical protein
MGSDMLLPPVYRLVDVDVEMKECREGTSSTGSD